MKAIEIVNSDPPKAFMVRPSNESYQLILIGHVFIERYLKL